MKFIIDVVVIINNDFDIGDLFKVIMVFDYNVSVVEVFIFVSELL